MIKFLKYFILKISVINLINASPLLLEKILLIMAICHSLMDTYPQMDTVSDTDTHFIIIIIFLLSIRIRYRIQLRIRIH